MTSFLQHLAGRVLEPQTSLRPRLASAFEPPQSAPTADDSPVPAADEGEHVVRLQPPLGRSSLQSVAAPRLVAPRISSPAAAGAAAAISPTPAPSEPLAAVATTTAGSPSSDVGALPLAVSGRLSSLATEAARVFVRGANGPAPLSPSAPTNLAISLPSTSFPAWSPQAEPELSAAAGAHSAALVGALHASASPVRRSVSEVASALRVPQRSAQLLAPAAQLVGPSPQTALGGGLAVGQPPFVPARGAEAPAEPVVNITIGRVEIKSAAPSPVANPPRGAQRPQLGLGDYLAQRGKAGR